MGILNFSQHVGSKRESFYVHLPELEDAGWWLVKDYFIH